MTRNDADAIVHILMNEWKVNADPALAPLWDKVTPFLWQSQNIEGAFKCTLNWPEWDLSVVTFDVPSSLSGVNPQSVVNSQHIVLVEDVLTTQEDPVIVHAQIAVDKYPDHKTVVMPVAELVDSFLANEWTPWWTCRCCHQRKQRKIKPE